MTAPEPTLSSPFTLGRPSPAAADTENWKLLAYFNAYRLAIAGAGVTIVLILTSLPPFGATDPDLFRIAGLIYLALAAIALPTIRMRKPDFETQATTLAFADVALLTLLMHASGGVSSGLGLLLVVATAGVSLMLGKRTTVFFAAAASIAVLLEHSWGALTGQTTGLDLEDFPRVGILGVGLFATAVIGFMLATRLRTTEALAERRGATIANLKHVNELIIERMQAGVLACGANGEIRFINQTAQKFLGVRAAEGKIVSLSDIAPDLAIQLFQWLGHNPTQRTRKTFTSHANYALLPRFAPLGDDREAGILIFLDDMAVLKQQAQQLKMAALARLTASIAHEIRNPLGAITSAAQLLGESVPEDSEQRRLTRIIEEQGRRMNTTIQNVTQLGRRDRVNPSRLALKRWLNEFIDQYCTTVHLARDAFALVGPDVDVMVDADQFAQVLTNLCQNALHASPPFTGTALLKLQIGTDTEDRWFLDIIDWGSGVPPAIIDNIFDPFFTTTPRGTGLGLYIARELCEGNGGTLDYYPGEGSVGSRFRITFTKMDENADNAPV